MNCAHNGNIVHRKNTFRAFNINKKADRTDVVLSYDLRVAHRTIMLSYDAFV